MQGTAKFTEGLGTLELLEAFQGAIANREFGLAAEYDKAIEAKTGISAPAFLAQAQALFAPAAG